MSDIYLVDDHALVRTGMKMILSGETDMEVIGEAECGEEVLVLGFDGGADAVDAGCAARCRGRGGPPCVASGGCHPASRPHPVQDRSFSFFVNTIYRQILPASHLKP